MQCPKPQICFHFNNLSHRNTAFHYLVCSEIGAEVYAPDLMDIIVPADSKDRVIGFLHDHHNLHADKDFRVSDVLNITDLSFEKAAAVRAAKSRQYPYNQDADTVLKIAYERVLKYQAG